VLPSEIEEYRDIRWHRDEQNRVETVAHAERFIDRAGFAACMLDSRQPGPSLYIAVCGRRDAVLPRNVQKDPESSHTWFLKDDVLRRGKIFYGKLSRGKATFVAARMVPYWNALWGVQRRQERKLSAHARAILRVLRKEWEMGTADLRAESGVSDRKAFTHAIDELQAALLVVPTEAIYQPKFTYLWGLAEERFPEQLSQKIDRATALREVARCFLDGAGLTVPGELARVTGLSRPDAGLGNRALVKEGYAVMLSQGTYRLKSL
jgi:winged helix DNA-binding protein